MSAEKLISKFLRQESVSKSVAKFVLRHAAKGRSGHEVETFEITEALTVEDLDNLAAMIVSRAQMDADGVGPAIQRYTLTSYIGVGNDEKASGRQTFRLRGNSDIDVDGDEEAGEESPTNKGLLSQLMRHNEANSRTIVQSTGAILTSMARRMEQQDKLVEKLMEDRLRSLEIVEEAMTRKHERDMEMAQVNAKEQRIAFGLNKIMSLLPVALSALSKGRIPADKSPMALMVGELVDGLTEDQIKSIATNLSAEQRILFLKVYQGSKEQKKLPEGPSVNGTQKEDN
jgi:hypothetical protein